MQMVTENLLDQRLRTLGYPVTPHPIAVALVHFTGLSDIKPVQIRDQVLLRHVLAIPPEWIWANRSKNYSSRKKLDGWLASYGLAFGKPVPDFVPVEIEVGWGRNYVAPNGGCCKCGRHDHHETHHVYPRSAGGSDEAENLAVLCAVCHAEWHTWETQMGRTWNVFEDWHTAFVEWLSAPPLFILTLAYRQRDVCWETFEAFWEHYKNKPKPEDEYGLPEIRRIEEVLRAMGRL